MNLTVNSIEIKLANGVQNYTAQEVATLLNIIKIQDQLLGKRVK